MPIPDMFRSMAGGQQGTFSDYLRQPLQPRPIDTQRPAAETASGWAPGYAAGGEVALDFLRGVRQNRVSDFMENEGNNQRALESFQEHVNARLQDPDLTDEGRKAILDEANQVMNQHMQYEVRDVPKGGAAGFFKNLLINATGGPIKTREPINWNEATGRITNIASGFSQKKGLQQALEEAQQIKTRLSAGGKVPTLEEVQQALAPVYNKVLLSAPSYAPGFLQSMSLGHLPPGEAYNALLAKKKLAMLQDMPAGQPTEAPPDVPESAAGGYLNLVSPSAAPPTGPAEPNRRAGSWMTPEQNYMVQQLQSAPALVREDILGKSIRMNLHAPGRGEGYQAVTYPGLGIWLNPSTYEPYPLAMQSWEASTGVSGLPRSEQFQTGTMIMPDGTEKTIKAVWDADKHAFFPASVVTDQGVQILGGVEPLEEIIEGGRRIFVPRGAATRRPPAPPQENPGAATERELDREADSLQGEAVSKYPNNPEQQRAFIAASNKPEEIKARATRLVGRPSEGGEAEKFKKAVDALTGGVTPATPPPPPPPPPAPAASGDIQQRVNRFRR